jgi:hypothetical protein
MSKLSAKIKEEFVALIPPTVYFFVGLHVVAFIRVLMLKGTGISLTTPIQIAVGALILGKAVLIADLLPFINRYPDKPLAYNIAWKTAIYVLVAMLLHYLERLVDFWRDAGDFLIANQRLLGEVIWPHFWAIQIILTVLVFNYCVMSEIVRAMGAEKVRQMFFGTSGSAPA